MGNTNENAFQITLVTCQSFGKFIMQSTKFKWLREESNKTCNTSASTDHVFHFYHKYSKLFGGWKISLFSSFWEPHKSSAPDNVRKFKVWHYCRIHVTSFSSKTIMICPFKCKPHKMGWGLALKGLKFTFVITFVLI